MKKILYSVMALAIAAMTFTACEDVPAPYDTPTGGGTGGGGSEDLGTAENPITVAKALETINGYADGKESSTEAYVKGVIVSVENYNSQYKSITYYISDDGTENGKLQVYSGKGLNGADFAAKTDLNKGAIVVVKGKLKKYVKDTNVTPEINQSSQIISIENNGGGDTPAPTVVGSIDNPVSVATALTAINALSDGATSTEWYYIKGKVKSVKTAADKIAQYKNIDYFITDDGNNELQIFRGKNLNNTDFTSADQLKVDDEVIVYGQLMKYKNNSTGAIVPEVAEGNYLVKTSNTGGGGTEPGGGGGEVSGNAISVNFSSLGLSNQEKVSTLTLSDGTTLTFDGGGNSNSPAYYNTGTALRMYPKNTMTINAGSKKIAAIEIECNEYSGTVYNASGDITVNNTKMTIDGLKLKFDGPNASTANIANASTTTGAPSQLRMMTLKITYAE